MISHLLISAVVAAGVAADEIGFNRDVRPILSDNCFKCHGFDGAQRKAGLRLDLRESVVGEIGAIIPGDAANSELVKRITSDDPNFHMPPPDANLALTDAEIQTLITWIDEGAKYEPHWSFIPPADVAIPDVESPKGWETNPIDAFILDRLREEGLEPSPEASPEELLRRASFDLTGLPPTLEDVDAFLNDTAPGAYERAVERLLASPAYGERMAMVWLDLARYADTFGYQNDYENFVWPWRDWVIRAFNDNLPYDDFLTWQVAGDLLPNATQDQVLATAFNRLHRQTNEGGSVLEEWRLEYVADRVKTFGMAFMGMTMECARCHDHKFDPITQREFYAMGAFFSNIDESGMYSYYTEAVPSPTLLLMTDAERANHADLQKTIAELERELAVVPEQGQDRFEKWFASNPEPVTAPDPVVHVPFDSVVGDSTPVQGQNSSDVTASLVLKPALVEGHAGKAIEFSGDNGVNVGGAATFDRYDAFSLALWTRLPEGLDRGVIAHKTRAAEDAGNRGYELVYEDGKLYFMLAHFWPGNAIRIDTVDEVPTNQWLHVVISYDGSSKAAGTKLYINGQQQNVEVVRDNLYKTLFYENRQSPTSRFPNPDEVKVPLALAFRDRDSGLEGGVIDELKVYDRALTPLEVRAVHSEAPVSPAAHLEEARTHYFQRLDPEFEAALEPLRHARDEEAAIVESKREIMVMREMDEPRPDYVMARGEYDKPGDFVAPDTPAAVMPFPESYPQNRLGLAQWATHPDNPLTARVAVNLFWQTIFGKGIVESQEDFGSQGKLPSHPLLLDYLAEWFQQNDWDVKGLVKLMVTSATYKQDSDASPDLLERDPYNILLARGPSHRLLAEEIRDAALAASGLLVREIGGPSVKPYQPGNLWQEASSISYIRDNGDGLYRRSMYTFWKRTVPPPSMLTFDAPDRESCVARRERTNTPLQSLVLLNGVQFVEAARVLAADVLGKSGANSLPEQLTLLTRRLLARYPTDPELAILERVYADQHALYSAEPEAAAEFVGAGDWPVDESIDNIALAAMTAVAQLLMNFDEFVMKS